MFSNGFSLATFFMHLLSFFLDMAGQIGWGLAWYINDALIPEIHVERGKTYTFIVYGGDDRSFLGNYHPLYITNSPDGGYAQKTTLEKQVNSFLSELLFPYRR